MHDFSLLWSFIYLFLIYYPEIPFYIASNGTHESLPTAQTISNPDSVEVKLFRLNWASKGQRHVLDNFLIFLKDIFRFKEQNGYLQLNVKLGDKFDIMCPKVKSFAETINPTEPLFLALWNVNRRGFNSCTVDKRTSKRLVRCNVPDYEKKYTMRVQVSFFLI